jgi:hypothetical protein
VTGDADHVAHGFSDLLPAGALRPPHEEPGARVVSHPETDAPVRQQRRFVAESTVERTERSEAVEPYGHPFARGCVHDPGGHVVLQLEGPLRRFGRCRHGPGLLVPDAVEVHAAAILPSRGVARPVGADPAVVVRVPGELEEVPVRHRNVARRAVRADQLGHAVHQRSHAGVGRSLSDALEPPHELSGAAHAHRLSLHR